jgi:hypothetical protein
MKSKHGACLSRVESSDRGVRKPADARMTEPKRVRSVILKCIERGWVRDTGLTPYIKAICPVLYRVQWFLVILVLRWISTRCSQSLREMIAVNVFLLRFEMRT